MPGIVVFRRRWMVASDDFVIPFSIAFVVRGIWLIILGVAMILFHGYQHQHGFSNPSNHICQQTLDYFIGGYLALLLATNIMEVSVAWMSGKGAIMDTEPRNLIPSLLYVRLMLSIIEVAWLSVGIKWIFLDTQACPLTDEIYIARAVVVFNWLFLFIVTVIIFFTFDTAGRTWFAMQRARDEGYYRDSADGSCKYRTHITQKYERRWQGCFRYAFCCKGEGQGDDNVYAFIGRTLSEYFQDLDVVPSDFAAGLVLLRQHQKVQEQVELERALQDRRVQDMTTDGMRMKKSSLRYQRTNNARVLNLNNKDELLAYKEIAYYMTYALAAYGWPLYMKTHLMCGCCNLGSSFRCCYGCRDTDVRLHKAVQVDEDNCCRCHFSALKRTAGLHNTDVIYVSYHNSMYKSPFYVALDHSKKAVVVTIRGTLSLQDILTDFTVEPERVPAEGGDPLWYGHKGMVRCAVYIQRKLEHDGILQRAFNADPDCGTHSYRLILLGHSLGAGTAAILAFLLRPRYPDLFCYAYSPPGANLSLPAAKYAREFVISVVIGKDMIPRLSLFTLEDLRNRIMTLVTRSRIPKWKILRGCACRCAFACCYGCKCVRMEDHQDGIDSEVEHIEIPDTTHSNSMRFYPPGRILHVVKTVSVSRGCGRKETMFEPVWSDLGDYQSIKISGLMWMDHMPDFVLEALNKCLPSKEHEQAIMNGHGVPRGGPTLDVPHGDWYSISRTEDSISYRSEVEEYSVEVPSYRVHTPGESSGSKAAGDTSGSKDSVSIEFTKGRRTVGVCCKRDSPMAPLARPESAIDDSDLEDNVANRVSDTWKEFKLTTLPQSMDSLVSPRGESHPPGSEVRLYRCCESITESEAGVPLSANQNSPLYESANQSSPLREPTNQSSTSSSISSLPYTVIPAQIMAGYPPPKPPRTFEVDEVRVVPIVIDKAPPKPPRTFQYVKMSTSSLDWDFPHSRPLTLSSPEKRSQMSLPVQFSPTSTRFDSPGFISPRYGTPEVRTFEFTETRTTGSSSMISHQRSDSPGYSSTGLESPGARTYGLESPGARTYGLRENRAIGSSSCSTTSSFSYSIQDTQVTYLQDKSSITKLTNGLEGPSPVLTTNPLYAANVLYGKQPVYGTHVIRGQTADSEPAMNSAGSVDVVENRISVRSPITVNSRARQAYDLGPVYRPPLPGTYLSDEKLESRSVPENRLKFGQKSASLSESTTTDLSSQVVTRRGRGNRNRNKRRAIYFDSDETSKLFQYSCSCSDIPDRGKPVDGDMGRELERGLLESIS